MEYTIFFTILFLILYYPAWEKKQKKVAQNQIVLLIQQAHANMPFNTPWDISVSSQMRAALCSPLTAEQTEVIANCVYPPEKRCFEYHLLRSEWTKHKLSGVVSISIEYKNSMSGLDLHFENVLLSVCCSGESWKGWHVSSVDIIGK